MGKRKSHKETITTHTGYPTSILKYSIDMNDDRFHETQKPIDLCEYLIKTYSTEGDIILDNTIGGGTTAIACINTNRSCIGIELDINNFNTTVDRVEKKKKEINFNLKILN